MLGLTGHSVDQHSRSSELASDQVSAKLDDVKAAIQQVQAKTKDAAALTARGAEVWLVPTYRPINEWRPVARRKLEGVTWSWAEA